MPENLSVNFSIVLSPGASEQIRRFGAPSELATRLADTLNDENEACLNEIRQRLDVQGAGRHNRGSRRGIRESRTGAYEVPHKVSGRLQRSMGRTNAIIEGFSKGGGSISKVRSTIGSGIGTGHQAVAYAAIQEYGGTIHVESRLSRAKKYQRVKGGRYKDKRTGRFIPVPMTKAYDVEIPGRSYLMSTVNMRQKRWSDRLSKTVDRFYRGK